MAGQGAQGERGVDITLDQRLAYPMGEVGEVLRLSRNGNADVETMNAEGVGALRQRLGGEIYAVVWNLLEPAGLAGLDLEGAFEKKARRNEDREW